MVSLAGASVALVILIDLATGQGPPALNSYLGPPPPQYIQSLPMRPIQYVQAPRGEYDQKLDKSEKESKVKGEEDDYSKESSYVSGGKVETTPSPGVFASFQNSMSDAWSK